MTSLPADVSDELNGRQSETLLGRRQANLCFHFAGSGENLPDITKSRDASLDNKELYSLTQIKQNSFLF